MTGVSAVIITRNEERHITRCVEGVKTLVQEVIVVDSGSTDRTCALATEAGARVVHRDWTNYADQKNFANGLATQPYILSVDADEVPSPALAATMREAIAHGLHGAYSVSRLTNYAGHWVRHGGWYPDVKVRLFPREHARWEGAHVHEELKLGPGLPITRLQGDLLHYSYPSVADHLERIERYSELHARKMFEEGRHAGPVKLHLSPVWKFIDSYLLHLGFLDGAAGWHIARLSARAVRLKYQKLDRLHRART
ncbi:MAG: glycosyltransferase family 2 protein [Flavobacteriales bacterium]|nr:glycosyltransferase family 2 protein [Flavobacteriales bacterium]